MASPTTFFEVKWSHQGKKEKNCGQHCVSMICKLPMAVVTEFFGHSKGTCEKEVTGALSWFGWDYDILRKSVNFYSLPNLAIIHVFCQSRYHHWAVYYDGYIYDSCIGIWQVNSENLKKYRYKLKGYIKVHLPN